MTTEVPDEQRPASTAPTESQLESETPGGSASAGHDPYAALRYPQYRRYAIGSTLSNLGQQMQNAAIGWEVALKSSHSETSLSPAVAISLVGLVGAFPVIALALPAGHLADTMNRKRLTIITLLLGALSSVGLAGLSYWNGPILLMYTALFASATMAAIGGPARSSLLVQIVPLSLFANAATWASSWFQIAAMAGPALAGFIIGKETIGFGAHGFPTLPLAYLIDAGCGICFAILLLGVTIQPAVRKGETASLQTLLAGIHFVRLNKIILATITLDLFAVLLGGATYMLPLYAKDVLHVGAVGFGWLRAAPAIGAFGMAIIVAHLPPMKKAGRNLLLAVTGFGVATIIFGISHSFLLSMLMLLLTGAFDNISVVVRHTLVQVLTPDSMRGRVSAVNNVFIGASNELGGFESGLAARALGLIPSVVAGGIGTIVVVLTVAGIWPQVSKFGSLADARPIAEDAQ